MPEKSPGLSSPQLLSLALCSIVVLLRYSAVEVLESYVFFSSSPPSEDRLHRFSGQYSQVSLIFEGKRETLAQMLDGEQ